MSRRASIDQEQEIAVVQMGVVECGTSDVQNDMMLKKEAKLMMQKDGTGSVSWSTDVLLTGKRGEFSELALSFSQTCSPTSRCSP